MSELQVADACKRHHFRDLAMMAVALTALLGSSISAPTPLLVWNASPSSPIGLYWAWPNSDPEAGQIVIAWPPDDARSLAAARHYLPSNVPLVKEVAAAAGDRVCAAGDTISVNGKFVAGRRAFDPSGRAMPWWTGCETLGPGHLFLLSATARNAFDGRYFGITRRDQLLGQATLLWRG